MSRYLVFREFEDDGCEDPLSAEPFYEIDAAKEYMNAEDADGYYLLDMKGRSISFFEKTESGELKPPKRRFFLNQQST